MILIEAPVTHTAAVRVLASVAREGGRLQPEGFSVTFVLKCAAVLIQAEPVVSVGIHDNTGAMRQLHQVEREIQHKPVTDKMRILACNTRLQQVLLVVRLTLHSAARQSIS